MGKQSKVTGVIGSCALFVVCAMAKADATYTFESLNSGQPLVGQDNWQYRFASPQLSPLVGAGTGVDTTKIAAVGANGNAALVIRPNDANFSFTHFAGTETSATEQFDVYLGNVSGQNFSAAFALGHGSDEGPVFGVDGGPGPGGNFFFLTDINAEHDVSIPSDVNAGDWVRFSMTMDFTANVGDGSGSLFYQDLTSGGARTAVAGLQNIDLHLSGLPSSSSPSNWDEMFLRLDNSNAGTQIGVDNLVPSAAQLPSSRAMGVALLMGLSLMTAFRRLGSVSAS